MAQPSRLLSTEDDRVNIQALIIRIIGFGGGGGGGGGAGP